MHHIIYSNMPMPTSRGKSGTLAGAAVAQHIIVSNAPTTTSRSTSITVTGTVTTPFHRPTRTVTALDLSRKPFTVTQYADFDVFPEHTGHGYGPHHTWDSDRTWDYDHGWDSDYTHGPDHVDRPDHAEYPEYPPYYESKEEPLGFDFLSPVQIDRYMNDTDPETQKKWKAEVNKSWMKHFWTPILLIFALLALALLLFFCCKPYVNAPPHLFLSRLLTCPTRLIRKLRARRNGVDNLDKPPKIKPVKTKTVKEPKPPKVKPVKEPKPPKVKVKKMTKDIESGAPPPAPAPTPTAPPPATSPPPKETKTVVTETPAPKPAGGGGPPPPPPPPPPAKKPT
jgi:hypothetical protein